MNLEEGDVYNIEKENAEAQAEHRRRIRFGWTDLIEEMIQDGQERGAFDDLRGMGKPLKLKQNPYGSERELAYQLMKENDVLPPWIVKRNGIVREVEEFRAKIRNDWVRYEQAFRVAQGQGMKRALSNGWDDSCQRWEKAVQAINKQIQEFNLARPSDGLEIVKLRLDKELARTGAMRWLLDSQ